MPGTWSKFKSDRYSHKGVPNLNSSSGTSSRIHIYEAELNRNQLVTRNDVSVSHKFYLPPDAYLSNNYNPTPHKRRNSSLSIAQAIPLILPCLHWIRQFVVTYYSMFTLFGVYELGQLQIGAWQLDLVPVHLILARHYDNPKMNSWNKWTIVAWFNMSNRRCCQSLNRVKAS